MLNFKIHLHKEDEGGYTVIVPSLPGCITYGETIDIAIERAREAIELYLEFKFEQGEKISDDANTLEYSVLVNN